MRYLALIYQNETMQAEKSEALIMEEYAAYEALEDVIKQHKAENQSSAALMPTNTATSIRVRAGKTLTTDGPFAETKEQLGGFYLLNCKDLDDAIKIASKIPAAGDGTIEIRPVMEFGE